MIIRIVAKRRQNQDVIFLRYVIKNKLIFREKREVQTKGKVCITTGDQTDCSCIAIPMIL
jgi:hypothetical protein